MNSIDVVSYAVVSAVANRWRYSAREIYPILTAQLKIANVVFELGFMASIQTHVFYFCPINQ